MLQTALIRNHNLESIPIHGLIFTSHFKGYAAAKCVMLFKSFIEFKLKHRHLAVTLPHLNVKFKSYSCLSI